MSNPPKNALKPFRKTNPFNYAIGMFGTSIPINMFKNFALVFYVETLGLDSGKFAGIIAIYAILDAIDNPVYGYLSDHTRTRWGRRRPWLILGTPLLVLFFLMFFNVPQSVVEQKNYLYIYCLATYLLTGTLDSLINANFGALFPELFKTDKSRSFTNALRQGFQLLAMVLSIVLVPKMTESIGYRKTSLIYGAIALVVIWYMTMTSHEHPEYLKEEKPKLFRTLFDLARNEKFWIFGLTSAFYAVAFPLVLQAMPLYCKYTLKVGGKEQTYILGVVIGFTIISMLIWSQIVKKLTPVPTLRAALTIMTLGFIPMLFVKNLNAAMCVAAIIGLGAGGSFVTMDVIGAKVLDDDFKKHGIRREALFSSAMGALNRLNGLYSGLALIVVKHVFGYISGDEPGPNPGMAAKFLLVVFPVIAMVIGLILSFFIKFKNDATEEQVKSIETNAE